MQEIVHAIPELTFTWIIFSHLFLYDRKKNIALIKIECRESHQIKLFNQIKFKPLLNNPDT